MTQFSEKFQKTLFLDHFWPFQSFLPDGDFFQKSSSATHNYIWTETPCQVSEKTNEPIPRKLQTDRRTDGRTDGQTLFYRTLPTKSGGPTTVVKEKTEQNPRVSHSANTAYPNFEMKIWKSSKYKKFDWYLTVRYTKHKAQPPLHTYVEYALTIK